jgi:hypothetical protein
MGMTAVCNADGAAGGKAAHWPEQMLMHCCKFMNNLSSTPRANSPSRAMYSKGVSPAGKQHNRHMN